MPTSATPRPRRFISTARTHVVAALLVTLASASAHAATVDTLWLGNDGHSAVVQEVTTTGTVVRSFSPGTITGIAINAATNTLYLGQHPNSGNTAIIQLRDLTTLASTGTLVQSPGPLFGEDLAFDGTYLYRADYSGDRVWKVDPSTGAATVFISGLSGPVGLAWDGTDLWVGEFDAARVGRYTGAGTLVAGSQFSPATGRVGGLAWDTSDNTLWLGSDLRVYHLTTAGTVLGSFASTQVFVDGLEFQAADVATAVPVPAALLLIGLGALMLYGGRRGVLRG